MPLGARNAESEGRSQKSEQRNVLNWYLPDAMELSQALKQIQVCSTITTEHDKSWPLFVALFCRSIMCCVDDHCVDEVRLFGLHDQKALRAGVIDS